MKNKRTKKYKFGKITFTGKNLHKVFFKNPLIKKGDILEYYSKISPFMILHTKDRPANVLRAPNGVRGSFFYQQNIPKYFPEWIDFFKTFRISKGGFVKHVLLNKPETIVYFANEGAITFHIWNSKKEIIKKPDRIVFDLDPYEEGFEKVRDVAFILRRELEKIGGNPYVMTTGSRGVHLILPIKPDTDYKKVKQFTKRFVSDFVKKNYDKATTSFLKSKRSKRVFLDYLRNNYGQTDVAPYSIRLRDGAPIACPIFWTGLHKKDFGPQSINIRNIFTYLRKGDPWKDIYKNTKSVKYYIKKYEKSS